MRIARLLVLWLAGVLIVAGCGRASGAAVGDANTLTDTGSVSSSSSGGDPAGGSAPAGSAGNVSLQQEIEAAAQKWESHGVTKYSLRVRHSQPTWNVQIIDITVENGEVVESKQDCFPLRNCALKKLEPQNFTIEALFEVARRVAALGLDDVEITFTEMYGYPNAIIYEDGFWNLEGFKLLEP